MDFIRVGRSVLHARRDGDPAAQVLVLTGPLGADHRAWDRTVAYLAERFLIVRYDLRGHGLSDGPTARVRVDDLADDLAGLLDQLDTGPAIVAGLGLGALTGLALSSRRPELAAGLVLMGSGSRFEPADGGRRLLERARAGGLSAIEGDILASWFTRPFLDQRADEVRGWRAMLLATSPTASVDLLEAMLEADLDSAARAVRVPALLLVGEHEPAAVRRSATALAAVLRDAPLSTITGAAHLMPATQPGPVAAAILGYAERVRSH